MPTLENLSLGLIQGVAEWLPISSQGIVTIIARNVFGMDYTHSMELAIWLHIGTLTAAIIYLREDLVKALKGFRGGGEGRRLLQFLIISTLSTAVTAIPLLLLQLRTPIPTSITTALIGITLITMAKVAGKSRAGYSDGLRLRTALVTGLAQGLAIIPGVSRSGVTVLALLAQGVGLRRAFTLSFLMSIPVTAGAQLALPLFLTLPDFTPSLALATLSAAVAGLLTIHILIHLSSHKNYTKMLMTLAAISLAVAGLTALK
ncbi:MAG: undecaprenyl-diphosphate phosphatase [Nitrososphaerota archaeon]